MKPINNATNLAEQAVRHAERLQKVVSAATKSAANAAAIVTTALESGALAQIKQYLETVKVEESLVDRGWVPHPLFSDQARAIGKSMEQEQVDAMLIEFIKQNWSVISESLLNSEAFHALGPERRTTFEQCVNAHEAGYYRCVPRTLFAEIELASRDALSGIKLDNGINASLKPVFSLINDLPVALLPPQMRSSVLLTMLTEEVYADTRYTASARSLPNRHDQIHGYSPIPADYKDSLNMLFLADVMFSVLAVFVKLKSQASARAEGA